MRGNPGVILDPGPLVALLNRRDFAIYRMHGRKLVPSLMPDPH